MPITDGEGAWREDPQQLDGFHEECGVFGVFGSDEANVLTALGCTPCSIAGRKQPVSSPSTARTSTPIVPGACW